MTKEDYGYTIQREEFMIREEDMIYFRWIKSIIIIIFYIIDMYCLYLLFFSFSSSSYSYCKIVAVIFTIIVILSSFSVCRHLCGTLPWTRLIILRLAGFEWQQGAIVLHLHKIISVVLF